MGWKKGEGISLKKLVNVKVKQRSTAPMRLIAKGCACFLPEMVFGQGQL